MEPATIRTDSLKKQKNIHPSGKPKASICCVIKGEQ
jgi:hypothetical protein